MMTETLNYKRLSGCLCCTSTNLSTVLDLKSQPLANSYLKSIDEHEDSYPLALNYCSNCTHLQLTHAVNPDLLFKNYLYVSGTTKTLRDYFDNFVDLVAGYFNSGQKLSVLDIACNDGSQLNSFKKFGHSTYGIDPAQNLHSLSSVNHEVVCDYFSGGAVEKLSNNKFSAIIAQNVLAHNSYPKEFLRICSKHLLGGGKVFIQTSQADMVKFGQFDTIYHEHISFFNVNSMVELSRGTGLWLQDVVKTDIHGKSYVFVLSGNQKDYRGEELIAGDFSVTPDVVEEFSRKANQVVSDLKNTLAGYRNHVLVGYGAAAKGNTLLNFGGIDLDYIVDDNPLKHGLYTPGRKIPIVSLEQLRSIVGKKQVVWIPLSWNFFDEIKGKVKNVWPDATTFIKYFPAIDIAVE